MTTQDAHAIGFADYGRYYCRRCVDNGLVRPADERYSMQCYAGMLCDDCWDADGRNHDRAFDAADAGEAFDESDY
jgi:hypothetical protein